MGGAARGDGARRGLLDSGLERAGRALQADAGECAAPEESAWAEGRCDGRRVDRAVHGVGFLRGSFAPPWEVRQGRQLTRHRTKLTDQRTSVINRLHSVLEQGNLK